jgi:CRP/FNR family transcriptional regulator, nitrogen oxide reductase regulator
MGSNRWVQSKNLMNSPVRESALLAGLGDDAVQTLSAAAQTRHLGPNVVLITEGQRASHIFLIKNGNARFYRVTSTGENLMLLWLGPGDIVGLGSLLAQSSYLASAETMSRCELLVWNRARIRSFAASHPKILENGLGISAEYLRNSLRRHGDLATVPPEVRIARSLLHLADKIGRMDGAGIEIDVNNERLGSLSDVSRFTASRVLAGWVRSGRISRKRGKVILHAPDALIQ